MESTVTVHTRHHNRVPMLLSVTFDKIATLVWNFYWAHKLVARWITYSCVYFYLWPFRFVAVSVCGCSGLWPFRSVAVPVCGRFGLWPFRSVAVPVCGRFGLWPFRFWPFRFVAVMTRIRWVSSYSISREFSGYGLSQCETTLQCNVVSHILSSHTEWSLMPHTIHTWSHRWSLEMNTLFHLIHYNWCDYLSILGLKLIHVSKRTLDHNKHNLMWPI